MKKKKLLIFHPTIAPYRIGLFNSLYEAFDAKVFLTWDNETTFDYDNIYSQLKFSPSFLKRKYITKSLFFYSGYWRILKKNRPDIVVVSEYGIGTIFVLIYRWIKRAKYKIVSICDDSFNMIAENNDFSKFHRLARKYIAPRLDEIILVEPKARDWYQKKMGKGFYFPIIRPDDQQRCIYSKVFDKSISIINDKGLNNKNVFLFVGRFVALKNIPMIIKAFSMLDQDENILVLIGNGEEEYKIRNVAKKYDVDPIFTGRLEGDDLYAWYNVADYFILASWQEAFGAVTNEALLAGCFSLVSKRAGSHCLIEEGINGFIFDPMKIEELYKKMVAAINTFPKIRPLRHVKKNLMPFRYDEALRKMLLFINELN